MRKSTRKIIYWVKKLQTKIKWCDNGGHGIKLRV